MDEFERRVRQVARRQHGNITREQLLRLGLGKAAIAYRARTGRLYREHRGVFSVGRPARVPLERAAAAVLACGPQAALSHRSAFSLWGLDKQWVFPAHVSGPTCRTRPRIVTHRVSSLADRDVRSYQAIRVTSPARTLLDHAPNLDRDQLRRALADARRSKTARLTPSAVTDVLERNPTHPGHTPLLQAWKGYQPTRSDWEDRLPAFCRDNDLPIPVLGVPVHGCEVDAYFPEHGLIIELDSWEYHQDRGSFESDRDRDAHQLAHGTHTVRVTWERITETPRQEANRLRQILDWLRPQ